MDSLHKFIIVFSLTTTSLLSGEKAHGQEKRQLVRLAKIVVGGDPANTEIDANALAIKG